MNIKTMVMGFERIQEPYHKDEKSQHLENAIRFCNYEVNDPRHSFVGFTNTADYRNSQDGHTSTMRSTVRFDGRLFDLDNRYRRRLNKINSEGYNSISFPTTVFVFDERGEAIAMIVAPDGSWTSAHDVLVKGLNWFMNPLATLGGGEVTKKSLKNPDERNIKEINLGILSRAHGL